jgi:nicotinamidase-related amidase
VNADQCVLATLMDANFLGYDTILLEDALRQCFGFTTLSTEFHQLP